jgi:steroid delta-isomerase-like uncharacterized protein
MFTQISNIIFNSKKPQFVRRYSKMFTQISTLFSSFNQSRTLTSSRFFRRFTMFTRISSIFIGSPRFYLGLSIILIALGGVLQATAATEEEMRAAMQGMVDALNAHDVAQINLYLTDDIVYDFVTQPPPLEGKEEVAAFFVGLFQGVPDFHSTQTRILVSGNIMVTEAIVTGTHLGELFGIPATGNSVQGVVLHIWEFEGDKVKRVTEYTDMASLMIQLGVMPAPEPLEELVPSFTLPDAEPTGLSPVETAAEADARWDAHDLSGVAKIIHPDAEMLYIPLGVPIDREEFIALSELEFLAFPDARWKPVRSIDMGDGWVVTEIVSTGTHDGPYMGIPATGRSIMWRFGALRRFDADGLFTNLHLYYDNLTLLAQLGLIPPPADTKANKAVVQRVADEVWNQGNLAVADELFATDFVNHDPNFPDVINLEGYKGLVLKWRAAFPDYHVEVHDMVAEGDKVGARYTVTGTHKGDFFGVPATYIQVTMKMLNIYRLAGGKIAEVQWSYDLLGVGQQIRYYEPIPKEVFPHSFARRTNPEEFVWGPDSDVTGDPGAPESNKALLVREVEEGWGQGDVAVALDVIAPTFVWHAEYPEVTDYESYVQWGEEHGKPTQIIIEDIFAEGDKVVELSAAQGGALLGIRVCRFADGKMVEMWRNLNILPVFIAMGVLPSLPSPLPEGYDNVFFMSLLSGLNMISLPLKPITPYTARSFAKELSATVVIKLDEVRQRFVGFTLDAPDDGFAIEGGKGYIVNVPEGRVVSFTGAAWTNQPPVEASPSLAQSDGAWAFVISGRILECENSVFAVTVRNTRTNAVATDVAREGYFAAAFADLTRKNVVEVGDQLEVTVRTDEFVSGPFLYTVTPEAIRQAFLPITLGNNPLTPFDKGDVEIPRRSLLLQNYPNPFNPETWIPYQIRESSEVVIRIYNAQGQLVRTLDLGQRSAGFYLSRRSAAYWNGLNSAGEKVASGIYFYQLRAGDFSSTRRMLILK